MHKKRSILAFITAVMFLVTATACGDEESDGRNYGFNYALESNPQNLDPQLAEDNASLTVIENMFEGLTTIDENGALTYGVAETCEISDDGLTYTFKLRDDCYWYDGINDEFLVTADDFVFAFQRIFNPITQSPYRETFLCLENAGKIINGELDYTEIGVHASDSSTVVFELDYSQPCFMEMLSTAPAMPCNQDFFESTKACYGLNDQSVISNGSFYMKQWFYDPYGNDNFIFMRRNSANYSEKHDVTPYSVNFIIEKSDTDISENFKNGDYDCIISDTQSDYKNILSKSFEITEYADRTVGIIMNTASEQLADENIRMALAGSVNRDLYKDKLISSYQVAYGIVPPCMMVGNALYRDYADEKILSSYDEKKVSGYLNNADIPAEITLMTAPEYAETLYMNDIAKNWTDTLGITVKVEEVEISEYKRRIAENDYQLAVYEITSDYNNPYDILDTFKSDGNVFGYSDEMTNSLLKQAENLNSTEKRCQAYFTAEQSIIDSCGFIPVYYKKTYFICGNGSESLVFNPFTGVINFRYGKNYS